MTCKVFVGKEISSEYHKYRFKPPEEVKDVFFQFLHEKVRNAHKHCKYFSRNIYLFIYFCHIY